MGPRLRLQRQRRPRHADLSLRPVIDYAPNALGQATKAGTPAGNAVFASNVTYYPNGAIKHFTYGNGLERWVVQNPQKTVQQIVDAGGVMNDIYSYDPNGNVSAIVDELPGAGVYSPRSRWMSYDGLDRLKDAGSGSFGGDNWYHFTYDTLDNMRSWKLAGGKDYASYVYDASNRLTNIRNSAGATTVGLGYDPQGNLANKNGQAYSFDYGNRLRDVPGKEYYAYDAHGRRFQAWRPNNTQTLSMFSNAGQVMYQENSSTSLATDNIYLGGQLLVIRERNTATNAYATKYQHTDALGSSVAVTNDAASIIERTQYEPFGAAIGKTVNGIGYTGHLMDAATSLTYMQQRYYDPTIGAFLSVDPVTVDTKTAWNFNRYNYAANNPYRFTDPDGRKIAIVGDKEFKREVKAQLKELKELKELKATPTGKQIVTTLEKSKQTFTISENKGSSHATPDNAANAQNGQGSGGKVAHDPKWTPTVNTPNGPAATPSKVVLGHELSHAVDYDKGTLDRSVNPATGVRRSEEKAMGVENQIRQEMKLPQRTVC